MSSAWPSPSKPRCVEDPLSETFLRPPRRSPPFRVLVFPSVNEPGLEVIQALVKSNKVEILGGSSFAPEWDPSRLWVTEHLTCPALDEPDFREHFKALLAEHRVDLVFPTTDAVVAELAEWPPGATGLIVTTLESARVCLSKRATYERVAGVVAVPQIYDEAAPLPAFAKPDIGSGSRGGLPVLDEAELARARRSGLMVHEHLPGPEYTVDCLGDLDGRLLIANVRVRGRIGRGISLGTAAVEAPEIESQVAAIAGELPIRGPWFAQFKLDSDGRPKLLEVNARLAGSSVLTRLAGVNIPLLSVFLYAGWEVTVPRPMTDVRVLRHLRSLGEVDDFDWVIWDLDDTLVRRDGKPDPDAVARLYDLDNQGKRQLMLTRNRDPHEAIERLHLPALFVEIHQVADKLRALPMLLAAHGIEAARCILINDSGTENLAIQQQLPGLRIVMPDALDVLARERVS